MMKKKEPSSSSSSEQQQKAKMFAFITQRRLLKQMITNHINNRVQEFPDPITSTLILMASSPVQTVFCDEGLILFKTTHLPIFPYSMLETEDRKFLLRALEEVDDAHLQETYNGCGKFSVHVFYKKGHFGFIPKKDLLLAFVEIMMEQADIKDQSILQRLADIIVQRFLSSISVQSDDIAAVMEHIWGAPTTTAGAI